MAQEQLFADDYKVNLDVFEGPLDLLLYLIRREELDIYDIPIERITSAYMEFLEDARRLNLDSLRFSKLETLVKAIGLPKERICTHCFDGSSFYSLEEENKVIES